MIATTEMLFVLLSISYLCQVIRALYDKVFISPQLLVWTCARFEPFNKETLQF